MRSRSWLPVALFAASIVSPGAAAAPTKRVYDSMAVSDHVDLERSLRWILARERAGERLKPPAAKVAVFADAGSWFVGARTIVDALEADGVPCRVLDRTAFPAGLDGVSALILTSGWASLLAETLGPDASATIRSFVERGGHVLGISDGAFVFAKTVAWKGETLGFGFGLFEGTAEGPLAAIAQWPNKAPVRVALTAEGKRRGLVGLEGRDLLYVGGPRFLGAKAADVLATYPDSTAAAVVCELGKGEIVLVGIDLERPAPAVGGDDAPAPAGLASLLRALLRLPK